MTYLTIQPAERTVDRQASQVDVPIDLDVAGELLDDDVYEDAVGLFPGQHFRKDRGDGCYHLRIHRNRAWLHRDRWDPRRYPVEHFFETPALWGTMAAIATLAIAVIFIQRAGKPQFSTH